MDLLINERITERRKQLGMSQADLAEKSGIAQPLISMYDKNKRTPSHQSLKKLAMALEINAEYLLTGIEREGIISDHKDQELLKILQSFSPDEKESVLDFARYIAFKKERNGE